MAIESGLWLHEEVILLALDWERGTLPYGTSRSYALIGAVMTELLLAGRIRIEKVKRSNRVVIANTSGLGDPLVDQCLERIRTAKRPMSAASWVGTLVHMSDLSHPVAERLRLRGIVRSERRPFLWLFSRRVYPFVNDRQRTALIERLRLCLRDSRDPPPRDAALIGLLHHGRLLPAVLTAAELKQNKERIRQIAKAHPVAAAVGDAISVAVVTHT